MTKQSKIIINPIRIGLFFVFWGTALFTETSLLQAGADESTVADGPPKPVVWIYPIYPRAYLLEGKEGWSKILFKVNRNGKVEKARIDEASDPAFGDAAVQAIREWRFRPQMRDGHPESARLRQPFRFKVSDQTFFSLESVEKLKDDFTLFPLRGFRPGYPVDLKMEKVTGHVDIIVTINEIGKVSAAELEQSTRPEFEEPAMDAATKWEFQPFSRFDRYEAKHGKRADFVSDSYGKVKMRLTFLFQPNFSAEMTEITPRVVDEGSST